MRRFPQKVFFLRVYIVRVEISAIAKGDPSKVFDHGYDITRTDLGRLTWQDA